MIVGEIIYQYLGDDKSTSLQRIHEMTIKSNDHAGNFSFIGN